MSVLLYCSAIRASKACLSRIQAPIGSGRRAPSPPPKPHIRPTIRRRSKSHDSVRRTLYTADDKATNKLLRPFNVDKAESNCASPLRQKRSSNEPPFSDSGSAKKSKENDSRF
ncbi:hypothetical protein D918_07866 [Trichuris suis]|nr:hypothetical protein D918_07866 [Trichuris suis]